MNALFIAREVHGVTEYISRRTGKRYTLVPDAGGIRVQSQGIETTVWTGKLCEALRMIEMLDNRA